MNNNALEFVGHINALGPPIAANQTPVWLQEVQALAGIATTMGVLIALYIAADPRAQEGCRRTPDTTQHRSMRCAAPNRLVSRLKREKCCPRAFEHRCLVKRRGQ